MNSPKLSIGEEGRPDHSIGREQGAHGFFPQEGERRHHKQEPVCRGCNGDKGVLMEGITVGETPGAGTSQKASDASHLDERSRTNQEVASSDDAKF